MTFLKSSCPALVKDAWKSVRLGSTTYPVYAQNVFPERSALGCGEQCIWKISMNKKAGSHPFHAKWWEFWRRAVLAASMFSSRCLGCSFNVDKLQIVCVHVCCYWGKWFVVGDRQINIHIPPFLLDLKFWEFPKIQLAGFKKRLQDLMSVWLKSQ